MLCNIASIERVTNQGFSFVVFILYGSSSVGFLYEFLLASSSIFKLPTSVIFVWKDHFSA